MDGLVNNDYDHSNYSPITFLFDDLFNESNSTELNDIGINSADFISSNSISLSSPPQLVSGSVELENIIASNGYQNSAASSINPGFDLLGTSLPESSTDRYESDAIEIIAQPNPTYRPRYASEINRDKGRANRFIRTNNENQKHEYPTVKIPSWCHSNHQLYIGVTLVTVITRTVPEHCIHPYEIVTTDDNVIRSPADNSIYFRINEHEYRTRKKSFCITILKKKEDQLKLSEPMRLFDREQGDKITLENPSDPKLKKLLYQLDQSQFIFTIAQKQSEGDDFFLYHSLAVSNPMIENADTTSNLSRNHSTKKSNEKYICIPGKSNWDGGEKIVIFMPNPIKKKEEYTIDFYFDDYGALTVSEMELMDTCAVLLQTPECPFAPTDKSLRVSILIYKNHSLLSSIEFFYISPINKRSVSQVENMNDHVNNKKPKGNDDVVDDGVDVLPDIGRLSTTTKNTKPRTRSTSSSSLAGAPTLNEKLINLDKRLGQIVSGLENFVRTSDPSELFRATAFLLSKYSGNSSPLHDAIQNGHTQIALAVIEQTSVLRSSKNLLEKKNENDETPLLIAAKLNQWKIIEVILKVRSDLTNQKDKDGNNLFHLLANLSEDNGLETIKNALEILPEELKIKLLNEKNKQNQTPMNSAKTDEITSSLELLNINENNTE